MRTKRWIPILMFVMVLSILSSFPSAAAEDAGYAARLNEAVSAYRSYLETSGCKNFRLIDVGNEGIPVLLINGTL